MAGKASIPHEGKCRAMTKQGPSSVGISAQIPQGIRDQIDEFGTANKANRSEAVRLLLHRGLAAWAAVKAQHAPPP